MAGAAEAPAWLKLPLPLLASALGVASLAAHALVLGTAAPLGRAPTEGTLLAAAGIGWALWAAWHLRRAGTPLAPAAQPAVLVEEGPYRFGRHPMYLGLAAAMVGLAIALGVPTLLLAAAAFAVVVARIHVPFEEQRLRRHFGGWYSDYAARVRRWI
jgi:protein-S-isoprenylcysteine O-methyltransferase Ste14